MPLAEQIMAFSFNGVRQIGKRAQWRTLEFADPALRSLSRFIRSPAILFVRLTKQTLAARVRQRPRN
jgi:hypothetical protein